MKAVLEVAEEKCEAVVLDLAVCEDQGDGGGFAPGVRFKVEAPVYVVLGGMLIKTGEEERSRGIGGLTSWLAAISTRSSPVAGC